MMKQVCLAATMFAAACAHAMAAGSSAGYGMGGSFSRFDPVVQQYNQSGELFRIQGHCQSACTLFLAIKNVCVERSARLLFHAGRDRNRQISGTSASHMQGAYNAQLRSYLAANRAMETFAFFTVSGRDIIEKFGYRECSKK
jgi:hypothetical protein